MPRALVVDDDALGAKLAATTFRSAGYDVDVAGDGPAAIEALTNGLPDVVLLDVHLPGATGFDVLLEIRRRAPSLPVIFLTAHGNVADAVRAMHEGASDYVLKPFDRADLLLRVSKVLETARLRRELLELRGRIEEGGALWRLLGPGGRMQAVVDRVRQVADTTFTVLLQGETGSGKEVVARALHETSSRAKKPFVAVDCGAIPDNLIESELFGFERGAFSGADKRRAGRFRQAEGGTLFLDEITNLPLGLQAKLLRVIQERELVPLGGDAPVPLDVRFIAAANLPLEIEVKAGRFRQDLMFRLAEFTIVIPPLRERGADVLHLFRRFVEEGSIELRKPFGPITAAAAQCLEAHAWPGNVRELRNVARQIALAVESGGAIDAPNVVAVLGAHVAPAADAVATDRAMAEQLLGGRSLRDIADDAAARAEREAIRAALELTTGNKTRAAKLLGTDVKTLHVKIKRHGL